MKLKPVTYSVAIILLTALTSYAGNGYFNEVLRNHGYGYSDGYHAKRYCLSEPHWCDGCAPMQQPMMSEPILPQPILPEPMMQQPQIQPPMTQQPQLQQALTPWSRLLQPRSQQAGLPQPVMQHSRMAPAHFQQSPVPTQPVSYRMGHAVAPVHQPQPAGYAPRNIQPVTAPVAFPHRTPRWHW